MLKETSLWKTAEKDDLETWTEIIVYMQKLLNPGHQNSATWNNQSTPDTAAKGITANIWL